MPFTIDVFEETLDHAVLQGLATDMMQSDVAKPASSFVPEAAAVQGAVNVSRFVESGSKTDEPPVGGHVSAEDHIAVSETPADTTAEAKQPKSAAKSGSNSAWFGKAGGLLGRWTVPVNVKKEPSSNSKFGVAAVIDLT